MPIDEETIAKITMYCNAHVARREWYENEFDFIDDQELKDRIILEFQSARYIYKLGEALLVQRDTLHPFLKFQITQYAAIYEAIIVYLLWQKYADNAAVAEIEYHKTYRKVSAIAKDISILRYGTEELHLCALRNEKTATQSIKFDDKVDASVKIGFITESLGKEIKKIYNLRNAMHLETAVKRSISYELSQSTIAYMRLRPFVDGIKAFLADD